MKSCTIFCATLLCLTLPGCEMSPNKNITKVENGLRYQILISGEKDPYMSLTNRMKYHKVPAVSIVVIDEGKLAWAKGYGHISFDTNAQKVDTKTLFQAGSISKPVTAIGALVLVEQGKLALDANVNDYLKSWKIPDNEFTKKEKVTLRRLLSHTAGTSVHGFPGYSVGTPIPTIIEILEGKKPQANTDPVRVIQTPGKEVKYSGGGTTIVQLLIEDVTGEKFDVWMKKNVLVPFGMLASTFSQPLTQDYANHAAYGHNQDGKPVSGKWHIYPEMAAAGLWTTPTDLANFLITVLNISQGRKKGPISQALMQEALSSQMSCSPTDSACLGFFLSGMEKEKALGHGGVDEGFIANMRVYPELGKGWVIMTNGMGGGGLIPEIECSIADSYAMPGLEATIKTPIQLDPTLLSKFVGIYKDPNAKQEHIITIRMLGDALSIVDSYTSITDERKLYPVKDDMFFAKEWPVTIQFLRSGNQIDRLMLIDKDGKPLLDEHKKEMVLKKVKNNN